jgi:phytoene dehydrogenase-like protein
MALVLGADIEGLAAAATLAKAGRSVHVIDARIHAGGVAARLPFADGYSAPGLLNECALVRQSLLAGLGLERHRLGWHHEETAIHVMRDGAPPISIHRDKVDGVESADAEAYRDWRALIDRFGTFIRHVIDNAPPEVDEPGLTDLLELARQGLRLRSLGDSDMMELLRIVTLPARDWMDEQFSSDALKTGLVAPVLTGTVVGPRAAGTTAMILMREAARGVEPVGGLAGVVDALVRRCEELGVTFRLGQAPASILMDPQERRARGVLCGGEEIEAELVISALDPARTLLDLVEPGLLPHHVEGELKGWRARGDTAIQLIACSKAPEFGVDNGHDSMDRMFTARSLDDLERAADALKYRALPEEPCLDVRIWRGDKDTPAGGATLVVHVHGVSHGGSVGWDDDARSLLRDRIVRTLEQDCPGIRDSIVGDLLLTPCDLADQFNLPGGHLHLGEQALDQLWLQRPSIALSQYATPIAGLFLAGAGSHPGGPYLGGAGVLGARRALNN